MNNNITLKDIAKALNLSVSTVSKSLKDSYEIGKSTKQKVLEYARLHHYVPNRMAKGLKEGKTRSIGVVVCAIDNTFVAQALEGIYNVGEEKAYQFIIMQSKESFEQEKNCIELLYSGGIDGLLISPSFETVDFSHLNELQSSGLPIVLFDRLSDQIKTHKVAANNFQGAYDATTHLIHSGYRRIAHINTDPNLSIADERLKGYKKALEDHDIQIVPALIRICNYRNNTALNLDIENAVIELMSMPSRPDAIFTATDQISTRTLTLLIKNGYSVPNDVALIGFSNTELADALNPALSTVHQPAYQMGRLAAEKLISLIEAKMPTGHDDYETIILDTEINVRTSSRQ